MLDMPDGFEVPLYRGPLKPKLLLGAHRDFTLLMCAIGALAFLWKLWPLLPFTAIMQGVAVWGTRQDARWFSKISRVIKYARYYKA